MTEISKLLLEDALRVVSNMREEDRHCARAVLGQVSDSFLAVNRWQTNGAAWSLLQDGEPVAIFGLSQSGEWMAVAWLIATPAMNGDSWRKLIRHCRTVKANVFKPGSSVHRVEAHVIGGWDAATHFAERLGFEHEGTRRAAGSRGEDVHMWAIVKGR